MSKVLVCFLALPTLAGVVLRLCRILPQVGRLTIIMNDYPYLKYVLIGLLGLLVITNKDG